MCFWVIELHDHVFNWCLELLVVWNWVLDEFAWFCMWRTDENPSNFAQASSSRLSENIRGLHLSLREVSPRWAGVAWARGPLILRTSLAWERIHSWLLNCHCKRSRPGESSLPKWDNSLAQARSSSLSEIHCRIWFPSLF